VRFPEPYGAPELRVGPTRMFGFDDNDRNRIFFPVPARNQPNSKAGRSSDSGFSCSPVHILPNVHVPIDRSYHTIELEAFDDDDTVTLNNRVQERIRWRFLSDFQTLEYHGSVRDKVSSDVFTKCFH
jgi:hypothetical protein